MKLEDANLSAHLAQGAHEVVLKFEVAQGTGLAPKTYTRRISKLDELLYLDAIIKTALKNAQKGSK